MSNYYNTNSIIGGPLDSSVLTQLKQRQTILNKRDRTNEDLIVLNSNTAWVRLMSSVDVYDETTEKYSSAFAQKYVMQGGLFSNGAIRQGFSLSGSPSRETTGTSSYELSSIQGYVPMPGITNFTVQSKNQFGTLRVGTVEFQANSIDQLSEIERIFLRPGFSVLLEWGHSVYIDNTGSRVNGYGGISPTDFFSVTDKKDVMDKIKAAKTASSHNYDAMFAFVKNFTWALSDYGTYDCKIDLISTGEIVESLQILVDPAVTDSQEVTADDETNRLQDATPLHQFLYAIKTASTSSGLQPLAAEYMKIITDTLEGSGKTLKYFRVHKSNINPNPMVTGLGGDYFTYVPLYLLLAAINKTMVLQDQNGNIISFYTGGEKRVVIPFLPTKEPSKTPYITFPWHFILDPSIGFLPKPDETHEIGWKFPSLGKDLTANDITDICINVDFAIELLTDICTQPELTEQILLKFIQDLLQNLQDASGHINYFDLYYEEDTFTYYIVDRNLTPEQHVNSILDVVGLGSSVESLKISSRLTSKISSQVAISAQANGSYVGEELLAMQKWNNGLKDRIISKRDYKANSDPAEASTIKLQKLVDLVADYESGSNGFYDLRDISSLDIAGLKAIHRRTMSAVVSTAASVEGTPPPGLIPLNLDLTMLGIGSIKIGQTFHIPDSVLPASYRSTATGGPRVGFMVFDPSHSISNGRWVTNLRCGMVLTTKSEKGTGATYDFREAQRRVYDANIPGAQSIRLFGPIPEGDNKRQPLPSNKGWYSPLGDFPCVANSAPGNNFGDYRGERRHGGWDINGKSSTGSEWIYGKNIYPIQVGEVISAGPATGYGTWVRIKHIGDVISVYGHVVNLKVSVGQQVTLDTVLAQVGSEGRSSGPHLHFEIWDNSKPAQTLLVQDGYNKQNPGQYVYLTPIT